MGRRLAPIVIALGEAICVSTATAKLPKGVTLGSITVSPLADSTRTGYLRFSNVFCYWKKDEVWVHVTIRNSSVEGSKLTISPRYYIAGGGEHGSSLGGWEHVTVGGKGFKSAWINAEQPKGTPRGSKISRCAPEVILVEAGSAEPHSFRASWTCCNVRVAQAKCLHMTGGQRVAAGAEAGVGGGREGDGARPRSRAARFPTSWRLRWNKTVRSCTATSRRRDRRDGRGSGRLSAKPDPVGFSCAPTALRTSGSSQRSQGRGSRGNQGFPRAETGLVGQRLNTDRQWWKLARISSR